MCSQTKLHIIIVGGGAGGLNLATRLSRSLGRLSALDTDTKTILLGPVRDSAQKLLAPQRSLGFDYLVLAIGS